jgi:solute:Na+ symporter, SSS family
LFSKNVIRPICLPQMRDDQVMRVARMMVLVLAGVSLYLALHSSATLVALLLLGYSGVSQFFPGVVLGLFWPRANGIAVLGGLIGGLTVACALTLSHRDPFHGLNAGFIALALNFVVTILVSAFSPKLRRDTSKIEQPVA